MSLIVACPNCQTRYNLPPKFEGKKVKCKSCGKPFSASVGVARGKSTTPQQQAVAKVRQTDPDELAKMGIGTIRNVADPFAAPVHTGPDPLRNHVVQDPGFGMPAVGDSPTSSNHSTDHQTDDSMSDVVANPYINTLPKQSSSAPRKEGRGNRRQKIVPTAVSFGDVFKYGWATWTGNLGLLLGMTAFVMFVSISFGLLQMFLPPILLQAGTSPGVANIVGTAIGIFSNALNIFLVIGQTQVILKLLRQQQTGFSELFGGASVFSPTLTGLIVSGIALLLGFMLIVIPGLLLMLFFWPYYYLIVDEKTKAFESFGVAKSLAAKNVGVTFVLAIVSFGLYLLGFLAVFVGLLFAAPLVSVIWGAAYLMMSGQAQTQG